MNTSNLTSQTQDTYVSKHANVVTIHTFNSAYLSCFILHSSNHHTTLSKMLNIRLSTYITKHKKLLMCICVYCAAECSY